MKAPCYPFSQSKFETGWCFQAPVSSLHHLRPHQGVSEEPAVAPSADVRPTLCRPTRLYVRLTLCRPTLLHILLKSRLRGSPTAPGAVLVVGVQVDHI